MSPSPSLPATDTPMPSATPLPALVILLAPIGSDGTQVEALQTLFAELADQAALRFETRTELSGADLGTDVRLVVGMPPDPGLADLALENPEVQFLAIGIPTLQPTSNLSVIGSQGDRPDRQGFLAGYTAAVITQDWRVAVISLSDTASGLAARQGFLNGVVFYCGLCRAAYPPFIQYPSFYELPSGSSQEEQQAAADYLIDQAVKTVYVFPGAVDEPVLEYLAQADVNLIGGTAPPAGVRDHWVVSVSVDLSGTIEQIWPDLLNGNGGISLEAPLLLTDHNTNLLSPGRQRLVEEMQVELSAGYIDTGVDPLTGEAR